MSGQYIHLFQLRIEHGYFDTMDRLALQFSPDAAAAAWLKMAGGMVRPSADGLRVMVDSGRVPGPRLASRSGTAAPESLCFRVISADPQFGVYTDGLDSLPKSFASLSALTSGKTPAQLRALADRVGLCFDFAAPGAGLTPGPSPWFPVDTQMMPPARQGFHVIVPLHGPEEMNEVPVYRIMLKPRAVPWKYLLYKDKWLGDTPRIFEDRPKSSGSNPGSGQESDTATGQEVAFEAGPDETLADGRTALSFVSTQPLPLAERARRRITLQGGAGHGHKFEMALPNATAANLARAGPDRLVAEILVNR